MPKEDEPLGPVGTSLLFENHELRIWRLAVPARGTQNWHHHGGDYVSVTLAGPEAVTAEFEDGSYDFPTKPGTWWHHAGPHLPHRVVNDSDVDYEGIIIEPRR